MKPSFLAAYFIAPNICLNMRTTESESTSRSVSRVQDGESRSSAAAHAERIPSECSAFHPSTENPLVVPRHESEEGVGLPPIRVRPSSERL